MQQVWSIWLLPALLIPDIRQEDTETSLEDKARELMNKMKDAQAKGDSKAYNKYMNELDNILNSM